MQGDTSYRNTLIFISLFIIVILIYIMNLVFHLLYKLLHKKTLQTKKTEGHIILTFFFTIFLIEIGLLLLYPFIQVIFDSFKPSSEFYRLPANLISFEMTMDNYKEMFDNYLISDGLINQLFKYLITFIAIFLLSILTSLGYRELNIEYKRLTILLLGISLVLAPFTLLGYNNLRFHTYGGNIINLIFRSFVFFLCILLSMLIYDKRNSKALATIIDLSLFGGLLSWFDFTYSPLNTKHPDLLQVIFAIKHFFNGVYASVLVVYLIIPIIILAIATPLALHGFLKDEN